MFLSSFGLKGVNMFGYNGPRKMTVLAPKMSSAGERVSIKPMAVSR